MISNLRALLHYGAWVSALCLFCLAIFWCVPTQTPVLDIDWSLYPGLSMIKGVDAAGNALPSLHVGSAVFSAFWLHRVFTTDQRPRLAALDQHPALRRHRLVHPGDPPACGLGRDRRRRGRHRVCLVVPVDPGPGQDPVDRLTDHRA